jgi:hypothetical protein
VTMLDHCINWLEYLLLFCCMFMFDHIILTWPLPVVLICLHLVFGFESDLRNKYFLEDISRVLYCANRMLLTFTSPRAVLLVVSLNRLILCDYFNLIQLFSFQLKYWLLCV